MPGETTHNSNGNTENLNNWTGEYITDVKFWGAYFSPLIIRENGKVEVAGTNVEAEFDEANATLTFPWTNIKETRAKAVIRFAMVDSVKKFSGTINPRPQNGTVSFTGLAQTAQPELDGCLVKANNAAEVYLVWNGGYKSHVQNMGEKSSVFSPNTQLSATMDPTLVDSIADGVPLTTEAYLARRSNGTIYLVTNGKKHPIADLATMTYYGFGNNYEVGDAKIDAIPRGSLITIPTPRRMPRMDGRLIGVDSGSIYLIFRGGYKCGIPNIPTLQRLFVNPEKNRLKMTRAQGAEIAAGPALSSDAYVGRKSNGSVYLVTNGQKHGVTNPATMSYYGFKSQPAADDKINAIPTGSALMIPAPMHLKLNSLKCIKTESVHSADKVYGIMVNSDGDRAHSGRFELNDGETKDISSLFPDSDRVLRPGGAIVIIFFDDDGDHAELESTLGGLSGALVGSMIGAGIAIASGGSGSVAAPLGEELGREVGKAIVEAGSSDDLLFKLTISTAKLDRQVVRQKRGSKAGGSESIYELSYEVSPR